MQQSRLDILINAKNNASGPIKQVQGDLAGLDKAAGSLAGGAEGLAAAVGTAGLLLLGQQALSAARAMAEQATQLRRVETAAVSLAGSQAKLNELTAVYQRVTGSLATDGEALVNVMNLQALGFANSSEQLERFLTAARGASLATGRTVDDIVNRLQFELANQSGQRLNELGAGLDEVKQRAAELAATNSDLSKEQAYSQAVLDTLVGKYGDLVTSSEAAATGSERLGTALRQMGEDAASYVGPDIDRLAGRLTDLIDWLDKTNSEMHKDYVGDMSQNLVALNDRVLDLSDTWQRQYALFKANPLGGDLTQTRQAELAMADLTRQLTEAGKKYNETAAELGAPLMDLSQLEQGVVALQSTATAIDAVSASAVIATGSVDDLMWALNNEAFSKSQETWFGITKQIDAAAVAAGRLYAQNSGADAGVARQQQLTDELNRQRDAYRAQGYDLSVIDDVLLPGYIANVQDADKALFDTTEQTRALKDAAKEAEQEFNNLKNKVQGVLEAALDPGVGVNPEDVLAKAGLRPDDINENARRLADIMVNGFKDQDWLGQFKDAVPDIYKALAESGDPKIAAAQMLREFEAGLRPELIDKEAAKERVRQMLLGEQNLAELAQEIAQELAAEMPNVGASGIQGVVNQALGIKGDDIASGLAAGQQYADGAVQAVSEQAPGTVMVATLTAQLKLESNLALLRDAGSDAGNVWGGGFLATVEGGVPSALIDLLVRLVTPGVQAGQAVKDSLEGAAQ